LTAAGRKIIYKKRRRTTTFFLSSKLDQATAGLQAYYCRLLAERIPDGAAETIADYLLAMKIEKNLSDCYREIIIKALCQLSTFNKFKDWKAPLSS
jgi:hypothetical protein